MTNHYARSGKRCVAAPAAALVLTIVTLCSQNAGTSESQTTRWAILVGISDYQDNGITPLRFASGDAVTVGEALLSVPHSGYNRDTVKVLAGRGAESPSAKDIKAVFRDIRHLLRPGDGLVVYISSHGVEVNERAFLVTSDTRQDDLEGTGLAVDELFRLLRTLPVRNRILLIDACHSGATNVFPQTGMGYAFHDALEQGASNSAVLSSSKIGQQSFESAEFGRGVFSYFLSQALRGAEGVDRDHDGQISLEEAAIFTERRLMEWGRGSRKIQQPWLIRTGSGAPPILTSLVPEVDAFGARAKEVDTIGTIRLHHRVQQVGAGWMLRGSVDAEGVGGSRGRVSLVVVLENGESLSWKVPIDPMSPLNILPERELPARPSRVILEEKFYDMDLTSFVPVRVEYVQK